MRYWRILVRRDTMYHVNAETEQESKEIAIDEEWGKITDSELDYERVTESWEVNNLGDFIEK